MHEVAFVRLQQSVFDKCPLIYCHVREIKRETFTGCALSQTRGWGLFGESEHSQELNFFSLENFAPTSPQPLGVNQRHKGYDVHLVTNDNMMCREST